jgi:hypothetical protein
MRGLQLKIIRTSLSPIPITFGYPHFTGRQISYKNNILSYFFSPICRCEAAENL